MRVSTRGRINLAFLLAALVVGISAAAVQLSISRLRADHGATLRSEQIRRNLEEVLSDLKDAETGQRGYLLTRQPRFLEPYDSATARIPETIADLRQQLTDSAQRDRLAQLEEVTDQRLELLAATIGLGQRGEFERAREIVTGGEGRELMDSARILTQQMVETERAELAALREDEASSARYSLYFVLVAGGFGILLAILSRLAVLRELRGREALEASIRESERATRELYRTASDPDLELHQKIDALLDLGRVRLGAAAGAFVQRARSGLVVTHVLDPSGTLKAGAAYPAVAGEAAPDRAGRGAGPTSVAAPGDEVRYAEIPGLGEVLETPIHVGGETAGFLCFSSGRTGRRRFPEAQVDFVLLMARWIGGELERSGAAAEIRQREERYRSLVESASDLIYTTDSGGRFTYVNPVAVSTMGFSEEELLAMGYLDLVEEEWRERTREFYETQMRDAIPTTYFEFPARTKDGRTVWIGQHLRLLVSDAGTVGTQAVARDITHQLEVARMKDEFLSVVSHELRTPLTAIRGSLGLLAGGRMGTLEARGQRMLEIAAQNTDRLVRLINELLDIEKIESGKAQMEKEEVSLPELVGRVVESNQSIAERAGVQVEAEVPAIRLQADPDRLVQVLTNLVSNAVKFSTEGGRVTIRGQQLDGEVQLSVADTGRGIPADRLESIFERFHQVDSSDAREKGGTGLGLPIARSIVQQHGGRIWAESRWGEGSTFHFTIPTGPAGTSAAPAEAEPLVLVCDDDPGVLAYLREILRRSGYRIASASRGTDAVEAAREHRPAAILLDLSLPGMSGSEVIERLRADDETRALPIVVVTGADERTAEIDPTDVVGWVEKPIDAPTLLRTLDAAVAGAAARCDVLLVEDDADLAGVVAEMLTAHGLSLCLAYDGAEAIEMSRRTSFRLLLLDPGLPGVGGFEVVDWMRRHNRHRSVPVIVYSARDLDDGERDRLRLGPTEFLVKSRSPLEQLERRVRALLASEAATQREG